VREEKLTYYSQKGNLHAIIECSAGTNQRPPRDSMGLWEAEHGSYAAGERFDFLPFPFNYGRVPGTNRQARSKLKDQEDPIDIVVICASLPIGALIETKPLALMRMEVFGAIREKVVAVPANSWQCNINAGNFNELVDRYPLMMKVIKDWFTGYYGMDTSLDFRHWGTEEEAMNLVRKWSV